MEVTWQNLGPSAALAAAERALRSLLAVVLADHYGAEGWLGQVASAERIAKWTEPAGTETRTQGARGVAVTSTDPLDYAQLFEMVDLTKRHWSPVAPALGKKAVTGALLDRLDALRNTVAHNREVLPFEEDLLAGIAGEIRNRATIYMSSNREPVPSSGPVGSSRPRRPPRSSAANGVGAARPERAHVGVVSSTADGEPAQPASALGTQAPSGGVAHASASATSVTTECSVATSGDPPGSVLSGAHVDGT